MRVLGIDPGVATIGFGVAEADRANARLIQYGVITTPAGLPLSHRLWQISQDMSQLLEQFQPEEAAVEELFFSKNITTGIAVAHGRGVLLLELERAGATFQNKQRQDVRIRYVAPVAAALVMVALMLAVAAVMLWAFWAAPADAPLALVLVMEAIPLLIICGVLYALFQRIREIGRGESDDAKQY